MKANPRRKLKELKFEWRQFYFLTMLKMLAMLIKLTELEVVGLKMWQYVLHWKSISGRGFINQSRNWYILADLGRLKNTSGFDKSQARRSRQPEIKPSTPPGTVSLWRAYIIASDNDHGTPAIHNLINKWPNLTSWLADAGSKHWHVGQPSGPFLNPSSQNIMHIGRSPAQRGDVLHSQSRQPFTSSRRP